MTAEAGMAHKIFVPDPENTRLLRDAFGRFTTGVTIVTALSEDGPVAITANSFSSVSLKPPLVMWAPGKHARRYRYLEAARDYAIHILGADQSGLCYSVAHDAHAIADLAHDTNEHGVPLLAGCLARFECRRVACYEGGDHLLVLGRVERAEMRDGDALAFYVGRMRQIAND